MQIDLKGLLQGLINVVVEEAQKNEEFHKSLEEVILSFVPASPSSPGEDTSRQAGGAAADTGKPENSTGGGSNDNIDPPIPPDKHVRKTAIHVEDVIRCFLEMKEAAFLEELDSYSVALLRKGAKELGIPKYSGLKKEPLKLAILAYLKENHPKTQTENKADEEGQESTDSRAAEEGQESTDSRAAEEGQESTDSRAAEEGQESTDSRAAEEGQESTDSRAAEEGQESQDTDQKQETGEEDLKSAFYDTNPIILYIKHGPEQLRKYLDLLTAEELHDIIKKFKLDNEHRTRSWTDPVRLRDHIFNRAEVRATQGNTFSNFDG